MAVSDSITQLMDSTVNFYRANSVYTKDLWLEGSWGPRGNYDSQKEKM